MGGWEARERGGPSETGPIPLGAFTSPAKKGAVVRNPRSAVLYRTYRTYWTFLGKIRLHCFSRAAYLRTRKIVLTLRLQ
jgi:hypothetical protein